MELCVDANDTRRNEVTCDMSTICMTNRHAHWWVCSLSSKQLDTYRDISVPTDVCMYGLYLRTAYSVSYIDTVGRKSQKAIACFSLNE